MVAVSNQIFFGDEGNDNDPLAGFAKVNLHTSYDLTDNIQIYGLIDNVFNTPLRPVRHLLQRGVGQRGGWRRPCPRQ